MQRATETYTEMGVLTLAGACSQDAGEVELVAGDAGAARAEFEWGDRFLSQIGEHSYRSTVLAMLAWARALLGERKAALAATELSEHLSAPEDVLNFTYTTRTRSALALADGDLDAAERWARTAVDNAYRSELYECRGGTKLQLSRVLAARGQAHEAAGAARAALLVYEQKGDQPRARQAWAQVQALSR